MTKDVINLNRARKQRDRTAKRTQADENAVKFGRSKAQKVLEATQNTKARTKLDGHQFESE
ncbi:DUF4169 family protein [Pseudoruegeria sp. HB172150]|uniref:DUF4169 family protein n=1 Tax=Pseudoruegeria sp. HB172150 TaxID=2721164 RepID=UPI0015535BBC|nr:DUF4169 family protein [Pseudoruegeria sp. HB172150]